MSRIPNSIRFHFLSACEHMTPDERSPLLYFDVTRLRGNKHGCSTVFLFTVFKAWQREQHLKPRAHGDTWLTETISTPLVLLCKTSYRVVNTKLSFLFC